MKKKICIVTGTRAEYGLLYWLMKRIKLHTQLEMQVIATGMHLSPEFGLTYKTIEEDGFQIDDKVEMLLSSDTPTAIAKSVGLGVISFTDAFHRLKPDLVVLLGDRFEIFAAAQAAMIMRMPIAHIHGGELTEGLIDDAIRHSITKMSQLHFTASEKYRERVIQMGEQPNSVFNVGALGIEGIKNTKLVSKKQLSNIVNLNLDKFFLITLHPTTLQEGMSEKEITILLKVLDHFKEYQLVFTKTNADTDGRIINKKIEMYVESNKHRASVHDSLGQINYLSALKHCKMVIGNSSSGIIEAPFFRKPTINLGIRQKGRLRTESIIDSDFDYDCIVKSINLGLSAQFKDKINKMKLVYGEGNTSQMIIEVFQETLLTTNNVIKKFYDIEE